MLINPISLGVQAAKARCYDPFLPSKKRKIKKKLTNDSFLMQKRFVTSSTVMERLTQYQDLGFYLTTLPVMPLDNEIHESKIAIY